MPVITSNNRVIVRNDRIINYSTIPRDGLIGEWLFNGNADDTSGNNRNGTVNGATLTSNRKSIENTAYSFDGSNDYISVSNYIDFGLNWTISIWLKLTNIAAYHSILYTNSYINTGINFYKYKNSGVELRINATTPGLGLVIPFTNFTSWNHITYIYDNGVLKGYLNGRYVNQRILNVSPNNNLLYFGRGYLYLNGSLDDIRIYNRVLTSNEIIALYEE